MTDSAPSLSPLIHLVDDDAAVREGLALLISTVGLRVQTWADPQSFMAGFDRASIGAIVLDVRMPGISGLTVLEQLLAQGVDHSDAILCRGLLAKAHLADGARAPALAHADAAAALIRKLPPASFHTLLGNVAVVELRLREWQLDATAAHRAAAREALRGLRWLAWACPIARPALWRAHAAAARLEGRPRRALRCDERACREAARLGVGVG